MRDVPRGMGAIAHGEVGLRFKQLGPVIKTGVHIVYDEKHVWFEVELQGAQGDREAEVEIWATKGLLDKVKKNVLGMEIVRDQSGDCDVKKNDKWSCIYAVGSQEYQMVCTRLDIASADVGSLKANLQHMKALSTTEAGYITFTEAWKKKIWLKGLLTESRYELRLVASIATGALVKGGSRSEVPVQVEVAAYRY
nr:hypothetical protein [Tanacetum cinerariifolium]